MAFLDGLWISKKARVGSTDKSKPHGESPFSKSDSTTKSVEFLMGRRGHLLTCPFSPQVAHVFNSLRMRLRNTLTPLANSLDSLSILSSRSTAKLFPMRYNLATMRTLPYEFQANFP